MDKCVSDVFEQREREREGESVCNDIRNMRFDTAPLNTISFWHANNSSPNLFARSGSVVMLLVVVVIVYCC